MVGVRTIERIRKWAFELLVQVCWVRLLSGDAPPQNVQLARQAGAEQPPNRCFRPSSARRKFFFRQNSREAPHGTAGK